MSSALDYARHPYKSVIAQVMTGVLDDLGIDRAYVVGQEVGAAWTLALATGYPNRVERLVLTGAAPLLREQRSPMRMGVGSGSAWACHQPAG